MNETTMENPSNVAAQWGLVACAMVPSSEQTETSAQIEQPEPETESAKPEVEPPEIVEPEVPAATKTSDGKLILVKRVGLCSCY